MANTAIDEILRHFQTVSWAGTTGAGEPGGELDNRTAENEATAAAGRTVRTEEDRGAIGAGGVTQRGGAEPESDIWLGAAATSAGQNVQGGSKTEVQSGSGSSMAATVIRDVFESGLGVAPLVSGILGLFGSGSDSPPPLLKYQMPASIDFMSADTRDQLTAADYDQMGRPRLYSAASSGPASVSGIGGDGAPPGTAADLKSNPQNGGTGSTATPQITVNVQAMDAQSFLERSTDIAQAVRSAMLNMSSINDIVSEL